MPGKIGQGPLIPAVDAIGWMVADRTVDHRAMGAKHECDRVAMWVDRFEMGGDRIGIDGRTCHGRMLSRRTGLEPHWYRIFHTKSSGEPASCGGVSPTTFILDTQEDRDVF